MNNNESMLHSLILSMVCPLLGCCKLHQSWSYKSKILQMIQSKISEGQTNGFVEHSDLFWFVLKEAKSSDGNFYNTIDIELVLLGYDRFVYLVLMQDLEECSIRMKIPDLIFVAFLLVHHFLSIVSISISHYLSVVHPVMQRLT